MNVTPALPRRMPTDPPPAFACDAMLGRLARWLRAAGYDASWQRDIVDWALVRQAQREGRILLSSDTGIFAIGIVRDGEVRSLFIPHGLGRDEQLGFVLGHWHLPVRNPRCMACGGSLVAASRDAVRQRVPARTRGWLEQFQICQRCGRVFWEGTHWRRIAGVLRRIADEAHPSSA